MFGLDTAIVNLVMGIAKPIAKFTETEKDDKVLDIIDLLYSGEYLKAMQDISELVDPNEE